MTEKDPTPLPDLLTGTDPMARLLYEVAGTFGGVGTDGGLEPHAADSAVEGGAEEPEEETFVTPPGQYVPLANVPAHVREGLMEHIQDFRRQVADIMPSNNTGIEISRIDAYFKRQGLRAAPVTILTPDNYNYFVRRLAEMGFEHPRLKELGTATERGITPYATYVPRLGRVIALRPPGKLSLEQQFELTHTIVHEKAHGTAPDDEIAITVGEDGKVNYQWVKTGFEFLNDGSGTLLEEAYAELKAAGYIRDELGMPNGLSGLQGSGHMGAIGGLEPVPAIYIHPNTPTTRGGMAIGAMPAYGLELIMEEHPGLRQTLDDARRSPTGWQQLFPIIERVKPGLFSELMDIKEDTPATFAAGLRAIKRALGRS